MSSQESKLTTSDAELIESARSGDTRAFGELWQRHYRSAARVARQCTSSIDADDLVSEAYARIFQRVLAGGGPDGAFRPYLYTTIRNLAATWGAQQSRDIQVDLIDDFEDERIPDDPAAWALDRTLTARAFRSLPERWQTVLWYTEVEGMDPHEVAPLMGMTANGVAALSYRAREGLRKAWLQAHINDAQASGECQFVMGRLGEHSRNGLGDRERRRVEDHLLTCAKCAIVSEEVEEVGSHLAFILLPLILGGTIGGGVLAAMSAPAPATAAAASIPALPAAVHTVGSVATASASVAGPAVVGGLTFASGTSALVGSLAVAAVLGSGLALGVTAAAPQGHTITPPSASQVLDPQQARQLVDAPASGAGSGTPSDASLLAPVTGSGSALGGVGDTVSHVVDGVGGTLGGTVGGVGHAVGGLVGGTLGQTLDDTVGTLGQTVDGVVGGVGETVAGALGGSGPAPVTVNLDLSGKGTPGATVSAQVAGTVYTTAVAKDGTWSLHLSGLPQGTDSAKLSQSLGGLIGGLLDTLGITVPLSLDLQPLGISVSLLD
jgi:RNA polymerase sigma factor (sigma-70 family)